MLIVVSPTKKQRHSDPQPWMTAPLFYDYAKTILQSLRSLSLVEIEKQLHISPALATTTFNMLHDAKTSPAMHLYQGEAFKSLDVQSLDDASFSRAKDNLIILSSVYGLLRATDAVQTYRLDFTVPIGHQGLPYLRELVTKQLNILGQPLINLASQEYTQLIDMKVLNVPIYTVIFLTQNKSEAPKIVGAHAKKARGLFARFILEENIDDPLDFIRFNKEGYKLQPTNDPFTFTFIRYL